MEFPSDGIREDKTEICCIEATVVTGFEALAKEECQEKIHGATALKSRGRILFDVPISISKQVLKLRSVDNVFAVVFVVPHVQFTMDKEESFKLLATQLDLSHESLWKKAFAVWKSVTGYDVNVPLEHNNDVKFRVTCNRTGNGHSFGSPEAAKFFGGRVQDKYGWKPDMTDFDLEIVLNIINEQMYVTVALTKMSLHRRNITYFGYTTLRSTIAHNMLRLAKICDGDLVCDPMCGSGAIPVEGAFSWNSVCYLCGDCDIKAATKTSQNVQSMNESLRQRGKTTVILPVFVWDVTCLPLKPNCIDVFVTDLPFGKRSGSKADNRILYPETLKEMARTCRLGSGRAVLLTHDRRSLVNAIQKLSTFWKLSKTLTTNIGGLTAGVYLLMRTNRNI